MPVFLVVVVSLLAVAGAAACWDIWHRQRPRLRVLRTDVAELDAQTMVAEAVGWDAAVQICQPRPDLHLVPDAPVPAAARHRSWPVHAELAAVGCCLLAAVVIGYATPVQTSKAQTPAPSSWRLAEVEVPPAPLAPHHREKAKPQTHTRTVTVVRRVTVHKVVPVQKPANEEVAAPATTEAKSAPADTAPTQDEALAKVHVLGTGLAVD